MKPITFQLMVLTTVNVYIKINNIHDKSTQSIQINELRRTLILLVITEIKTEKISKDGLFHEIFRESTLSWIKLPNDVNGSSINCALGDYYNSNHYEMNVLSKLTFKVV